MARGQQKVQSQQKNAERKAKMKKGTSQKKAANAALIYSCTVCKVGVGFVMIFFSLLSFGKRQGKALKIRCLIRSRGSGYCNNP